jgi:hypothetical protein
MADITAISILMFDAESNAEALGSAMAENQGQHAGQVESRPHSIVGDETKGWAPASTGVTPELTTGNIDFPTPTGSPAPPAQSGSDVTLPVTSTPDHTSTPDQAPTPPGN